ncbi:hypothetical protein EfmJHP36_26220 [Enterococcus faecium]|nr:hypothetical protein EfmJHP36_26220 [Enterococcus faecium]
MLGIFGAWQEDGKGESVWDRFVRIPGKTFKGTNGDLAVDIHRTLGLLLHTQVSIQQLLKLPAECFHPKPKVNSVLIKLTRHTTDVPDKYWKLYTYFVSKWVNREYRQLFTKNQFHQAMKHAKVNNLSTVTYEQVLSTFRGKVHYWISLNEQNIFTSLGYLLAAHPPGVTDPKRMYEVNQTERKNQHLENVSVKPSVQ